MAGDSGSVERLRMGAPVSEQPVGPGSTLRAEREALGVTLREVSETLNLSIGVIQSIEADEYDKLPGPVFARGYVRAYARLLDLEPDPLLARSPQRVDGAGDRRLAADASLEDWLRRRPALVLSAGVLLVVLAAALAALWLWPRIDADAGEDVLPIESTLPAVDELAFAAGRMDDAAASDVFSEIEEFTDEMLDLGDAARAVSSPVASAAPVERQAPGVPQRLTAAGDDRLALRFSADCWVQVRDADGDDLYSELSRAGDDLELVGQGPLRILLGYAPGVQLAFNGEPVPLGPHTRNNVATLVLGQ